MDVVRVGVGVRAAGTGRAGHRDQVSLRVLDIRPGPARVVGDGAQPSRGGIVRQGDRAPGQIPLRVALADLRQVIVEGDDLRRARIARELRRSGQGQAAGGVVDQLVLVAVTVLHARETSLQVELVLAARRFQQRDGAVAVVDEHVAELARRADVRPAGGNEEMATAAGAAQHDRSVRVLEDAQIERVRPAVAERAVVVDAVVVGACEDDRQITLELNVDVRVPLAAVPEVDRVSGRTAARPRARAAASSSAAAGTPVSRRRPAGARGTAEVVSQKSAVHGQRYHEEEDKADQNACQRSGAGPGCVHGRSFSCSSTARSPASRRLWGGGPEWMTNRNDLRTPGP